MAKQNLSDEFVEVLRVLTEWLESEEVKHTLIGGVAVAFVAQPRVTKDIDAVIWLDHDLWEAFVKSGERFGIVPRIEEAIEFAHRSRVLLLVHQPSQIEIDLSCAALPFELEMLERARTVKVNNVTLKIPTPEDLIVMKAIAHRPKDLIDIDSILSIST